VKEFLDRQAAFAETPGVQADFLDVPALVRSETAPRDSCRLDTVERITGNARVGLAVHAHDCAAAAEERCS